MFTFTHEQFSGPLDLLWQMVEEQHLNVTDVSLANLTDEYLRHVEAAGIDESEMADFLLIAAKLLYLKSKMLLPTLLPEELAADDLARQLKMYERFVLAAEGLKKILLARNFMYPRDPITIKVTGFQPPAALTASKLRDTFQEIVQRYKKPALEEVQVARVMSIKDKISHVQTLLITFQRATLKDFLHDPASRHDVVVTFLALLELVKQRSVRLEQPQPFQHIHVHAV